MLAFLPFPSSESKQIASAKAALAHVAESLDAKFSVRLWDGSIVPMGRDVRPGMIVSIAGPGVIGSLLRRPTLDNFVRHYATGKIAVEGGRPHGVRRRGPRRSLVEETEVGEQVAAAEESRCRSCWPRRS